MAGKEVDLGGGPEIRLAVGGRLALGDAFFCDVGGAGLFAEGWVGDDCTSSKLVGPQECFS
jgi:hypothetical protein